jgi:hypothetical protein
MSAPTSASSHQLGLLGIRVVVGLGVALMVLILVVAWRPDLLLWLVGFPQ